jgi:hypothetical protein
MMNDKFIIKCINDKTLFWNNADGWVEENDFDVFSLDETKTLRLPLEGAWLNLKLFKQGLE